MLQFLLKPPTRITPLYVYVCEGWRRQVMGRGSFVSRGAPDISLGTDHQQPSKCCAHPAVWQGTFPTFTPALALIGRGSSRFLFLDSAELLSSLESPLQTFLDRAKTTQRDNTPKGLMGHRTYSERVVVIVTTFLCIVRNKGIVNQDFFFFLFSNLKSHLSCLWIRSIPYMNPPKEKKTW